MKGFVKVAAISPIVELGDIKRNVFHIVNSYRSRFDAWGADVIVFPELCLTGCSIGDLLVNNNLIGSSVEQGILELINSLRDEQPIFIIGAPIEYNNSLYNCAVVINKGSIIGVVPKSCLPCHKEFNEPRWFASGSPLRDKMIDICNTEVPFGTDIIFNVKGMRPFKFGIEIGEDLWAAIPPSSFASLAGAEIIFNPSAISESVGRNERIKSLISSQSSKCQCGYVYVSSGWGESSTDSVYVPKSFVYETGSMLDEVTNIYDHPDDYKSSITEIDLNKIRLLRRQNSTYRDQSVINGYRYVNTNGPTERFILNRTYSKSPFSSDEVHLEEIFNIQVTSLMRRLNVTSGKIVIGVSGGSDSTLALLVAYEAMKKLGLESTDIHGVTMPCYGTTDRTKLNALGLMDLLGITSKKVMISNAVTQHRKDIGLPKEDRSVVYENCQARERTQVLMDYANMVGAIVLGTGDLSELALGWCTYNADHMSMYNVNVGVPKTLVKKLIRWYADKVDNEFLNQVLTDILDTPVSPELLPDQVTEDTVGPYELHDFFLYHLMRSGWDKATLIEIASETFSDVMNKTEITKWFDVFYKRFMTQQFKRSCLPDGPKVGSVGLSPRGDWKMPSDTGLTKY